MRYLEELEQKVLRLVQRNQDLQGQLNAITKENASLLEQIKQYEASLLKETHATQALNLEKANIVSTIEELLNNINALENAQ